MCGVSGDWVKAWLAPASGSITIGGGEAEDETITVTEERTISAFAIRNSVVAGG